MYTQAGNKYVTIPYSKIKKTLNIEIVSAIGGTLFTLTTLLKKYKYRTNSWQ